MGDPISDKQFKHLLQLSRLSLPLKDQAEKLKSEIDQLTQFTEHIKLHDFKSVDKPLTHIWKQDMGQVLRSDDLVESTEEVRGRDLLKYARKKSGNFYVVKGSIPSSD
jgi:aspartyl/glutamyl-tRNA(Asn/Gln) amidotransferase C subunit